MNHAQEQPVQPAPSHFRFQMWERHLTDLNRSWAVETPASVVAPSAEPTSLLRKLLLPLKRFIVRTVQPSLDALRSDQQAAQNAQREFNAKVVQTMNGLVELVDSEFARQRREFDAHLQTFQAQFDTFQAQFDTFQAHLNTLQSHIDNRLEQIEPRMDAIEPMIWMFDRRKEAMEIEQILFEQKLEQMFATLRTLEASGKLPSQPLPASERQEDYRYFIFENRHRGDEQDITRRISGYVEYFTGCSRVLDIGCGRGEFLELLREQGIHGYGIEPNSNLATYCRSKGLEVEQIDVFAHLQALPDNSLDGIFMAHVVEHFPPQDLQQLLQLCFAKLGQHKYFIAETPNPKSLYAFSHFFYKDVTHRNPLPSEALEFLVKCAGFQDIQVVQRNPFSPQEMLQELSLEQIANHPELTVLGERLNQNIRQLNQLLYGYPDYGMIARKINFF